jgi:hypothetical protein
VGQFVQVMEQSGRNITQTHQYLVLMLIATDLRLRGLHKDVQRDW